MGQLWLQSCYCFTGPRLFGSNHPAPKEVVLSATSSSPRITIGEARGAIKGSIPLPIHSHVGLHFELPPLPLVQVSVGGVQILYVLVGGGEPNHAGRGVTRAKSKSVLGGNRDIAWEGRGWWCPNLGHL